MVRPDSAPRADTRAHPTFAEALRFWLRLGFISFGGPTGQIAIMHAELVERRRWISEARFLHALNYCMLLPGPEAQQLATYCGWLLHGTRGGIAAGALFVLPAVFILWALSLACVTWGASPAAAGVFDGLKPAVLAVVLTAVVRIGTRALQGPALWAIAGLAFGAIFAFQAPFPAIIALAALAGWSGHARWPAVFALRHGQVPRHPEVAAVIDDSHGPPAHAGGGRTRVARVLATGLTLWWAPVLLAGWWHGWDGVLFREGVFFSQAAVVTFGGAYAVLPHVAHAAVETHGWLTQAQMMDGLAFAESTPGPLIMVLQHVGFMGGWTQPGRLAPLTAATLGALLTTWVTFVPSFLWIFLGAPHVERMRGRPRLDAALASVTAAVVGVVLHLAVWFGLAVIRGEEGGIAWFQSIVALAALVALQRFKAGIVAVILGCGMLGLARHLVVQFL